MAFTNLTSLIDTSYSNADGSHIYGSGGGPAGSTMDGGTYGWYQLFDHYVRTGVNGDSGSGAKALLVGNSWVAYKFPTATLVNTYSITGNPDGGSYYTNNAKSWKLEGSNNSTNGSDGTWSLLDTQDVPSTTFGNGSQAGSMVYEASFSNSTSYSMYKVTILSIVSGGSYAGIGEIQFGNTPIPSNAKLLLHFEGPTCTDEMGNTFSSDSVTYDNSGKFGKARTSGGVTFSGTSMDNIGQGNWCFEFWGYNVSYAGGTGGNLFGRHNVDVAINWGLVCRGSTLRFHYSTSFSDIANFFITSDNIWHHYAISKSDTTLYAYRDGTLVGSLTSMPALSTAKDIPLAALISSGGHDGHITGLVDEMMFIDGNAYRTGPFTPPTSAYSATPSITITGNTTAMVGSTLNFTATPLNAVSPTYKWYKNSSEISGATSSTYSSSDFINGDTIQVKMISETVEYSSAVLTLALATPSLLAHLDDTLFDSSDYATTITARGGSYVSGKFGKGRQITASGDHIEVSPLPPSLQFTGDFTIEFWVYINSFGGSQTLFEYGQYNNGLYLDINATNFNTYLFSGGATANIPHGITAGTWNHVVITRAGTTYSFYTNGVLKGSTVNAGTMSNFDGWRLGNTRHTDGGRPLNGILDEVLVIKGAALAPVSVPTAPYTYQAQPSVTISGNTVGKLGSDMTFTATANNASNPTYVWYKNGSVISGANSSSYTSNGFAMNDTIQVKMTEDLVIYSSDILTLTVNDKIVRVWNFESQTKNCIDGVTFGAIGDNCSISSTNPQSGSYCLSTSWTSGTKNLSFLNGADECFFEGFVNDTTAPSGSDSHTFLCFFGTKILRLYKKTNGDVALSGALDRTLTGANYGAVGTWNHVWMSISKAGDIWFGCNGKALNAGNVGAFTLNYGNDWGGDNTSGVIDLSYAPNTSPQPRYWDDLRVADATPDTYKNTTYTVPSQFPIAKDFGFTPKTSNSLAGATVVKGESTLITFAPSEIAALPVITGDAFYSNSSNWESVSFFYANYSSRSTKKTKFLASNSFAGINKAFNSAGNWTLRRIIIVDIKGGSTVLRGSDLPTGQDFTVA